jgi:hypothetical protein
MPRLLDSPLFDTGCSLFAVRFAHSVVAIKHTACRNSWPQFPLLGQVHGDLAIGLSPLKTIGGMQRRSPLPTLGGVYPVSGRPIGYRFLMGKFRITGRLRRFSGERKGLPSNRAEKTSQRAAESLQSGRPASSRGQRQRFLRILSRFLSAKRLRIGTVRRPLLDGRAMDRR